MTPDNQAPARPSEGACEACSGTGLGPNYNACPMCGGDPLDDMILDYGADTYALTVDTGASIDKLRAACAGSRPSAGHNIVDEVCGLLRVAREQRDSAERQLAERRAADPRAAPSSGAAIPEWARERMDAWVQRGRAEEPTAAAENPDVVAVESALALAFDGWPWDKQSFPMQQHFRKMARAAIAAMARAR